MATDGSDTTQRAATCTADIFVMGGMRVEVPGMPGSVDENAEHIKKLLNLGRVFTVVARSSTSLINPAHVITVSVRADAVTP